MFHPAPPAIVLSLRKVAIDSATSFSSASKIRLIGPRGPGWDRYRQISAGERPVVARASTSRLVYGVASTMSRESSRPNRHSAPFIVISILVLLGSIGVIISTANDLGIGTVETAVGLTEEENAYYEFVAPRLDRLVVEVDDVVVMVEGRSRDILDLTISGNRIEALTEQIVSFGDENGVPDRFAAIHQRIVAATDTTSHTFDEARESLRTFNFSNMSNLVTNFVAAADDLHAAQDQLEEIVGGTTGAIPHSTGATAVQVAGHSRA